MLLSDRPVSLAVRELADGTVTAVELVSACAGHSRDALAAARAADERRAAGSPLPLLGLPVAVDPSVGDPAAARAAGAIVVGTVHDAMSALDAGVCAVLGRPSPEAVSWRPAGGRSAVLTRDAADLPVLGPLLGVSVPPCPRLDGVRLGACGDAVAVLEAATHLSLAGLPVTDVDPRLVGRLARLRGVTPLAGADVLITDRPIPHTHAAIRVAGVTLAAPRPTEHVALALAALLPPGFSGLDPTTSIREQAS